MSDTILSENARQMRDLKECQDTINRLLTRFEHPSQHSPQPGKSYRSRLENAVKDSGDLAISFAELAGVFSARKERSEISLEKSIALLRRGLQLLVDEAKSDDLKEAVEAKSEKARRKSSKGKS